MANSVLCSVSGCGKTAIKRGWCQAHYRRWQRHGDPLAGRTPNGEAAEFLRSLLSYDGDECIAWPYAVGESGYGRINVQGETKLVSRVVCEDVCGPPPSPRHEAAHSCGNGHNACITPRHLTWKTPEQNEADKITHGTHNRGERHPMVKLTESAVRAIFSDDRIYSEIARDFSVSIVTISNIKTRRSWKWLPLA